MLFSARIRSNVGLFILGEVCNYCFLDWFGVHDDIDSTGLMNGKICDESVAVWFVLLSALSLLTIHFGE